MNCIMNSVWDQEMVIESLLAKLKLEVLKAHPVTNRRRNFFGIKLYKSEDFSCMVRRMSNILDEADLDGVPKQILLFHHAITVCRNKKLNETLMYLEYITRASMDSKITLSQEKTGGGGGG